MVRPILIPKLRLINRSLIPIERRLDSILFTSFWCPKQISTQAEILLHVLDFELKQFTEAITMITMGARNRLLLL